MKLYDGPHDVVRKAMRGNEIAMETLSRDHGIDPLDVRRFFSGESRPEIITRLAQITALDPTALQNLTTYAPVAPLPDSITRLALPFEGDTVNVWRIRTHGRQLIFDTGFGAHDLVRELDGEPQERSDLFITHGHRDHVGGLQAISLKVDSIQGPESCQGIEVDRLEPGSTRRLGEWRIDVLDLSGHHPRSLGYYLRRREFACLVSGDALFAGSCGGCPGRDAYRQARETLVNAVEVLPDDLLVLPGHGPATTLSQEKRSNPFLAAWLA